MPRRPCSAASWRAWLASCVRRGVARVAGYGLMRREWQPGDGGGGSAVLRATGRRAAVAALAFSGDKRPR
eukprot:15184230-Alexandrium_andersonii.AAC.1